MCHGGVGTLALFGLEGAASNRNRAGDHVIMLANQMHAALLAAGEIYKRPQVTHMGGSFDARGLVAAQMQREREIHVKALLH